jgi:hypothetical protein
MCEITDAPWRHTHSACRQTGATKQAYLDPLEAGLVSHSPVYSDFRWPDEIDPVVLWA